MAHQIIPFEQKHNDGLMALEKLTPQGKKIKLEMLRSSFLNRSEVFDKYAIYVAENQAENTLIGVAAVSIVPFKYQNTLLETGFGYDLKVTPNQRKKGIAKKLGKILVDEYLKSNDISDYFITLKKGNEGAAKAVYVIPKPWHAYDFYYLTIPTSKRIKLKNTTNRNQFFSTGLLSHQNNLNEYIIETDSGLRIWKTYKTYQLKIIDLPFLMNVSANVANLFVSKQKKFPVKGSVLKFATLFDYNTNNIKDINEVLQILDKKNIQYLNVCCTKEDLTYELLSPYSINKLPYTILNTFDAENGQHVTLDVRCL